MVEGLILVKGQDLEENSLMISLANAKQLIVGRVYTLGFIIHIAASSVEDYNKAFLDFSAIQEVSEIFPLMFSNKT